MKRLIERNGYDETVIMICLLTLATPSSSDALLGQAREQIAKAQTLSVTVVEKVGEFRPPFETRWWFRKGGYYRSESSKGTLICSPQQCWSYKPKAKGYMVFPGAQKDWSLSVETGLGQFGDAHQMPTIGDPKRITWEGMMALRVEVDGTKAMTKETKLYFFFDAKTRTHLGVSANLGSIEQVRLYKDLKINPKLKNSLFEFVPPRDWKQVKA